MQSILENIFLPPFARRKQNMPALVIAVGAVFSLSNV